MAVANLLFSAGPILLLIFLMMKTTPMSSARALPLAALVTYGIQLAWFRADPTQLHASMVAGLLVALTPILIVWGAIFLFRTMELSGALETIRSWLNHVSRNRVAQVVIIGWSFQFLIEGASGFGTPAALAALVFVRLMMVGGETSPVMQIGNSLAGSTGRWWPYLASYLGAVGAFFAGSCTISNLTFGPIQVAISQQLGLDKTLLLALQSVGGAMGNMVAIHNIIAVCSVLGLRNSEGAILRKTLLPMLVYGLMAAMVAMLLL